MALTLKARQNDTGSYVISKADMDDFLALAGEEIKKIKKSAQDNTAKAALAAVNDAVAAISARLDKLEARQQEIKKAQGSLWAGIL